MARFEEHADDILVAIAAEAAEEKAVTDIRQRLTDALFEKEVARQLEEAEKWFRERFDDQVLPELMEKDGYERDPEGLRVEFEERLPGLLAQTEKRIREELREGSADDPDDHEA